MNMLLVTAFVLLVGGSALAWSSLRDYRQGQPAARGRLVVFSALAVYGLLVLSGVAPGASWFWAAATAVLAVLAWAGIFMSIRDRRKARQTR